MKMGILRIKRTVRNRERGVSIIEVELIARSLVSLGPRELSVVERCVYYGGRDCMKMDIFRTKRTVRNREVSVL